MSTQSETARIPKLRFPEFSGDWEESQAGDFANIFDGTHQTPKYVESGIAFYSVEHITANQFNNTKYISKEVFERENSRVKLEKKDILMTRIGSIGVAKYIDWDVEASFYVSLALIKHNENFNSNFFSQQIHSPNFQKELWKRTIHVAFPKKINLGEIGKCICVLPPKPEQQKIASFLTSVDTKIEKLSKKQELLGEYKKGLMQKIFSQAIRFKADDGSPFPDWKEKKLGDLLLSYYQGINTTADKVEYRKEGVPILQAKHISNELLDFNNTRYVDEQTYESYKKKYKPNQNNILISNIGTLGKIVLIKKDSDFLIAWNIFKIEIDTTIVAPLFLLFALKLVSSEGYFEKMKTGNATKFVNKTDMINIQIILPSLPEQTKIANFLSSIDSKIEQVNQQLDETKQFKKALLQQMFV